MLVPAAIPSPQLQLRGGGATLGPCLGACASLAPAAAFWARLFSNGLTLPFRWNTLQVLFVQSDSTGQLCDQMEQHCHSVRFCY